MDIYEALDKLKQNKRIDRTARRKQLVEKKLAESDSNKPVKKPVKKLNESVTGKKSLCESWSDDYFDLINDLVNTAKSKIDSGSTMQEAIEDTMDEGLTYQYDILTLASEYDVIDYSQLLDDIWSPLYEDLEDRLLNYKPENESLSEAKTRNTKTTKL